METKEPRWRTLSVLFRAHPWHGVSIGDEAPDVVTCYVEIVPSDTVKYEIDKVTGLLKLDRPQKYSNVCPSLYGLVPQTLCAGRVAALADERTARRGIVGDDDPLDVCILTEKAITHGDVLVRGIPIGGMRMLDKNEADDKIVAVLEGDAVYGALRELRDCPAPLVDRLRHYFLTYKQSPDDAHASCEITHLYDRAEALDVIRRCQTDYDERFADLKTLLAGVPIG